MTEAQSVSPTYQPQTVNTDGWAATHKAWQTLFPTITVVLCFPHAFIRIRSCCQRLGSLYDKIRQPARTRVYSRQWEPRKVRWFLHQCAKLAPRFLSCVLAKQLTPTAVSLTPCPALPPRLDTP